MILLINHSRKQYDILSNEIKDIKSRVDEIQPQI